MSYEEKLRALGKMTLTLLAHFLAFIIVFNFMRYLADFVFEIEDHGWLMVFGWITIEVSWKVAQYASNNP